MEPCLRPLMEAGKEHWATGLMVGLTAPSTLFLANPEWRVPEKLGVFAFFAAVAVNYGHQNRGEVTQFGLPCAISLFLMAAVLFHGATTFDSRILAWAPVFICASLMMAVNVAPKVAQAMENTWRRLPITINIGRPYGTRRETDLEQGHGEYQDLYSEAGENQGSDSSIGSIDLNSVAPTTPSIRALMRQLDGNSGHDSREPANQIGSQVETPQRSMLRESPPWPANTIWRYSPPVYSAVTMSSSRRVENSGDIG